ncbi:MAG TPA: hypothetical protein VHC23_12620, partial [Jatrophihabitans sp.]|nr:hypothetical protein [Jatrophihabitans sp.]
AAALVTRFGSVEAIVAAAETGSEGFPAGAANRILAARDYLAVAPAAVRGRTDVPLAEIDDRLPATPRDPQRLTELAEALGVQSSVARLQNAISAALG